MEKRERRLQLAGEGFRLRFEDGEDFYEVGEFEDLAGTTLQAEKSKAGFEFPRKFEAFDERGDASAVNVLDVGQIHDDAGVALFLEQGDEHGAKFGRIVERDVTVDVHDDRGAGLASG